MFDFSKAEKPQKINRDFVLSKISDAQIFGFYHGPFKFNEAYPSKFRKDKHPSCGFYVSKSGKLIYNDMAHSGNNFDCFAFVAKMYNLSFSDAIKKIALDFGLITGEPTKMAEKAMHALRNFDKDIKKDTRIVFRKAKWDDENLAYWKKFHITKDELERENIYAIKDLWINDKYIPNKESEPRYALTVMVKGDMRTKVYAPTGDNLKWVSNIPLDVPFGTKSLKPGPFSFGAKAQKDRIILLKFLPAVYATQNESKSAIPKWLINDLEFNYETNYLGWDNDETGLEAMDEMGQAGFRPMFLPVEWNERYGLKDYSDLSASEGGLKAVEKFLKKNNLI